MIKKLRLYLLVSIFFLHSSLPSFAMDDNLENNWVMIVSKDSGKALDSWDPNQDRVGKYTPHAPKHQHYDRHLWMIKRVDNSYYTIVSKNAKKALDSWGAVDEDQVGKYVLHTYENNDYNRHLWMVNKVDNNYYTIVSKYSGKALDSCDPNQDRVGRYTPHFPGHQHYDRHLWKITVSMFEPEEGCYYRIVHASRFEKQEDAFLDADSNHPEGQIYRSKFECDNTKWRFARDQNNPEYYQIVNKYHEDREFPAFLDADSNKNRIYRSGFHSDNTKWKINPVKYYRSETHGDKDSSSIGYPCYKIVNKYHEDLCNETYLKAARDAEARIASYPVESRPPLSHLLQYLSLSKFLGVDLTNYSVRSQRADSQERAVRLTTEDNDCDYGYGEVYTDWFIYKVD